MQTHPYLAPQAAEEERARVDASRASLERAQLERERANTAARDSRPTEAEIIAKHAARGEADDAATVAAAAGGEMEDYCNGRSDSGWNPGEQRASLRSASPTDDQFDSDAATTDDDGTGIGLTKVGQPVRAPFSPLKPNFASSSHAPYQGSTGAFPDNP